MKFRKFGKALLMTAISAGVVFGVTSCVQSYSVGYLYVTGTQTSGTTGQGVISGFKIDHNTGALTPIAGLPISSGGANPVRAILLTGGRFVYVLNQGTTTDGAPCSATDVCSNANITQYSIGGNGVLAAQGTYYTQGHNPFRLLQSSSGTQLFALDHDAPDPSSCALVFPGATSCGDITVFNVDAITGRLSVVLNSQVTAASGSPLPYFPVPANPIDITASSNYFITLSGPSGTIPSDSVFPYSLNPQTGQLSISQNSPQPLGMTLATAIVVAGGDVYVLDDGLNTNGSNGQLFAYTTGNGGALQALANSYTADLPTFSYPNYVLAVGGNKWLYVLNRGDNANSNNPQSGIAAFNILNPYQLQPIAGQTGTASTPGTGPGPLCILEDPSNQYIYTGNYNGSSVTGLSIDENSGNLTPLSQSTKAKDSYALPGPATWCMVTGRTS